MITRHGWQAIFAGLIVVLLSFFVLHYLLVLLAVVAFAFIAAEIVLFHLDTWGLDERSFAVSRSRSAIRHAVGSQGRSEVTIRYRGAAGIVAEAFDVLPDGLELLGAEPRTSGWWAPNELRSLASEFRAVVRGSYLLGPTQVLLRSRLGLAERRISLPSERPVQVVPENPVRKPGQLRRAIFTRVQGRLQLRQRGYGTEFRSLRPYLPDDDIRHIAWRRSTPKELIVREFEQESRQDIVLVLDVSPAMLAGLRGANVLDRTSEAATLIVGFAQRSAEDRLGMFTYSGGVRQFLKPSRGAPHFRRLLDNVALISSRPGEFDLGGVLDAVGERLGHGAHVLLFSALDRPLDGLHRAHSRFTGRGHHLYVFVPDLATFYPTPSDPAFATALAWSAEEDRARLHRALVELRAEGIPTFTFDRGGAGTKLITAYGQIRAWGTAG